MASTIISFQLNDDRADALRNLQKRSKRTAISLDQFAKEIVLQRLEKKGDSP